MGNPDQPRGKDGRWVSRGPGPLVAAIALVLLGGSGVSVTGASGLTSTGSSAARSQSTRSGTAKARIRDAARTVLRLQRRGLQVAQRHTSADDDCASHSYRRVQEFFRSHPCTALFRALFEVHDDHGNVALVAVAWVTMPDPDQAREFQRLVDSPGSGNVVELSREGGRYRAVRFSAAYYKSGRDGTTVVNAQAQPVGRAQAGSGRPPPDLEQQQPPPRGGTTPLRHSLTIRGSTPPSFARTPPEDAPDHHERRVRP